MDLSSDLMPARFEALQDYSAMFRYLPVAAALLDEAFTLLDVNEAFHALTHYGRDQLIGKPVATLSDTPDECPSTQGCMQLGQDGATRARWSATVVSGTGRNLDLVVLANAFNDRGAARFMLVWQDPSHADWLLRGFDDSPVGFVVTDERGRLVRANRTVTAMTGAVSRLKLARLAGSGSETRSGGTRVALRQPRRATQWFDRLATQITSPDGQVLTLTALREVTVEHERRAQLQAELRQHVALLRAIDLPIACVVGEIIVMANLALGRLLGRRDEQLLGQPVNSVLGPDLDWQASIARLVADLPHAGVVQESHRLMLADGGRRTCRIDIRHVDPQHLALGLLVVVREI